MPNRGYVTPIEKFTVGRFQDSYGDHTYVPNTLPQGMAAEDVARLCEISDEDFSDQCRDDNDENYVPSENDEKSNVKDVLTGEKVTIKTEVEVNSDDEEEVNTNADTTETPPPTDVYCSSD
ncbi:hypothetical protein FQA39_LY06190 [Lamprigera yunnana]|nr:hypothetical protein FQA39_LY06190 [Lamprigera yunnana]